MVDYPLLNLNFCTLHNYNDMNLKKILWYEF